MADLSKIEAMLESLVNEDKAKAEELFHEFVIEKSREIYEGLLESDLEDLEEETDEEVEEAADEEVDESEDDLDEAADEEVDESDEEVEEGFDLEEFEVEADDEEEPEMDDEGEDEEGEEDGEGVEDAMDDLEQALGALKAEFDAMMGGEGKEDEGEEDGDMGGDPMDDMIDDITDEPKEEEFAFEGANKDAMMKDAEKMSKAEFIEKYGKENADTYDNMNETTKSAGEQMREYVEKVSAKMGDNGANTKSTVAGANDMGGTTANIAKGGDGGTGGKADTPKEDSAGNVNVPGGKASKSMKAQPKGHGAEKKGAGESGVDAKSTLGS
jgi:hypothetical protein